MRRKNISTVYRNVKEEDFTAIILAAGEADFIKSFGSNRSLVSFRGTDLINHQIKTLKKKYPRLADIIVVLGFDADRTYQSIQPRVRVVLNERWADTNCSHSLSLALKATITKSAIVISGDIYFEEESLILPTKSTLTIADMKKEKVGVSSDGGRTYHLAHGLPDKWAQISYFVGADLIRLRENLGEKTLLYEAINEVGGSGFDLVKKGGILEINSFRDVESIR